MLGNLNDHTQDSAFFTARQSIIIAQNRLAQNNSALSQIDGDNILTASPSEVSKS